MKVKITTTLVLETELQRDWYDDGDGVTMSEDEIIAWETQRAKKTPEESALLEEVISDGEISDFKIEKVEDTSTAQEQAA
jgi:hypothetical protein